MSTTNYQALATCACIGENFAVRLPVVLGRVEMPLLSTAEVDLHLGGGSSWDQRRAFEWGLLAGVARRNGEDAAESYCLSRIAQLKAFAGSANTTLTPRT